MQRRREIFQTFTNENKTFLSEWQETLHFSQHLKILAALYSLWDGFLLFAVFFEHPARLQTNSYLVEGWKADHWAVIYIGCDVGPKISLNRALFIMLIRQSWEGNWEVSGESPGYGSRIMFKSWWVWILAGKFFTFYAPWCMVKANQHSRCQLIYLLSVPKVLKFTYNLWTFEFWRKKFFMFKPLPR